MLCNSVGRRPRYARPSDMECGSLLGHELVCGRESGTRRIARTWPADRASRRRTALPAPNQHAGGVVFTGRTGGLRGMTHALRSPSFSCCTALAPRPLIGCTGETHSVPPIIAHLPQINPIRSALSHFRWILPRHLLRKAFLPLLPGFFPFPSFLLHPTTNLEPNSTIEDIRTMEAF